MDHGDYSILFFESTARDFLLGFFLVLPLLFRAAIKVVQHADSAGVKVTLKAYQEWAVEAEGRVREGALRRRLLGPRGRWASWGEMICDIRAGATA